MTSTIQHILTLKQAPTKYGKAPHKPVLLLAVIESFESGEIADNWIEVNDDLVQRFIDIWKLLVKTPHIPTFALPFFHLKNEKGQFWKLITYPGREIPTTKSKSIKSYRALTETVCAATLSNELYIALSDPIKREEIKAAILDKYFGIRQATQYPPQKVYSTKIKQQILYDPAQNYARKVKQSIDEQPKEIREEFVVMRSSVFRKAILEVYDNQCAVTGLKVADAKNRSLVDACHITPFAETYNDSIRNGLALSPTFHRAFDRGLIGISDTYRILVHPKLKDFHPEAGIKQFENRDIILPANSEFHPSVNYFREHRSKFGF
ncbi:HNH endonuclease [Draconibacterium halophilum]|uniref:HNH endonuclease n=1 Tax=Draconibacterium halophilum TaxID=2706887 RepID=A0A6C0R804_9BACT|nr:HNH endonuclease [Draconibacterium halophilum]QIA06468.1 HNH endonuclease [Draconibacterium halophilum]